MAWTVTSSVFRMYGRPGNIQIHLVSSLEDFGGERLDGGDMVGFGRYVFQRKWLEIPK